MGISISRIHYPVTALGPGRRLGIWFQGCSIQCDGCISVDTWAFNKSSTTVESVLETIRPMLVEADGLTISGGEPFDQRDALYELLTKIRKIFTRDVILFSGYEYHDIENDISVTDGLIDILICGPYKRDASQKKPLRGSDNQTLHLLSEKGMAAYSKYLKSADVLQKKLDIMFDDNGAVWLAGIPKHDDFIHLVKILRENGSAVAVTQHMAKQRET